MVTERTFGMYIGRIRRAIRREFEARAAALDITAAQFQILRRLWQGDSILTSVLAKDICADGPTVTGLLDRLESKGLIRRERSAQDRRAVEIFLTPAGRALEQPLLSIIEAINDQALAGFSDNQRKQIMKTLEKIDKNLNG